jgi:DNA (cytosine-5)-methyltransferase 1
MTVGSLFTGIGGIDLGLERVGMEIAWQCEINPYCREVLQKHWPEVRLYNDIRKLRGSEVEPVDIIAGGFPCQDISVAGKGVGLHGERSGLFFELMRVVREVRPRYVLMENVPMLVNRGLDEVLGELALCGYDAEWQIVSAASLGAPHIRERIIIVAYSDAIGRQREGVPILPRRSYENRLNSSRRGNEVSDASNHEEGESVGVRRSSLPSVVAGNGRARLFSRSPVQSGAWEVEPDVGRVADGVPRRMDRLRALGNAVVPQMAEYVGSLIVEAERSVA